MSAKKEKVGNIFLFLSAKQVFKQTKNRDQVTPKS